MGLPNIGDYVWVRIFNEDTLVIFRKEKVYMKNETAFATEEFFEGAYRRVFLTESNYGIWWVNTVEEIRAIARNIEKKAHGYIYCNLSHEIDYDKWERWRIRKISLREPFDDWDKDE